MRIDSSFASSTNSLDVVAPPPDSSAAGGAAESVADHVVELGHALWLRAEQAALGVVHWAEHTASSVEPVLEEVRGAASNVEGSFGFKFPVGPTVLGIEVSQDAKHGFRATASASVLKAFKASLSVEDADHDGKYELSGKASAGSYEVDGSIETPFG